MMPDPTPEHEWLKQLVGEWTYENTCTMGPDPETMTTTGRESISMLGELWTIGEMEGDMPGAGTMKAIMTLGFDPAKGKFIGTWIGSPMTFMFIYEGSLDEARRTLTLDTPRPRLRRSQQDGRLPGHRRTPR